MPIDEAASLAEAGPGGAAFAAASGAPGGDVSGEPTDAVAEPTPVEPKSAPTEPQESEPQQQIQFPSADKFGWDDWDGAADLLPEELRPWHEQFSNRWTREKENLEASHFEALEKARREGDSFKRLYDAMYNGEEDPRVAELTQERDTVKAVLASARAEWEARESDYKNELERSADLYMAWIKETRGEEIQEIEAAGKEKQQQLLDLMDDFELHHALDLMKAGDEAIEWAKKALKDEVPETYIMDLVSTKYTAAHGARAAAKAVEQKRKPNPSSNLVAGSNPTQAPSPPPPVDTKSLARTDQLSRAARIAIAAESGR